MKLHEEFDHQDEQGVWHRCRVVWTGDRGHYLCHGYWPMASALTAGGRISPAGSVTDTGSRGSALASQTALRA